MEKEKIDLRLIKLFLDFVRRGERYGCPAGLGGEDSEDKAGEESDYFSA